MSDSKNTSPAPSLPTADQILSYLSPFEERVHRREIAKAFDIKGDGRRYLKSLLIDMEADDLLSRVGKSYLLKGKETVLSKNDPKKAGPSIESESGASLLGILQEDKTPGKERMLLAPLDRRDRDLYVVDQKSMDALGAKVGDYVATSGSSKKSGFVTLKKILSTRDDLVRNLSTLAIKRYDIPDAFPESVIRDAEKEKFPDPKDVSLQSRTDIREIPLVTIDDIDARDHDDAVYAEPDADPNNEGGWRLLVAIADVAHFVKPGSPLDQEAIKRGNSTYFPDRVVPMLPEHLSNDLCSLRPHEDRPCLAVWMRISKHGKLLSQKFFNGLMRSHGKLTYVGVDAYAQHDDTSSFPDSLDPKVIENLYNAYDCLHHARLKRGTLEIDLPEQRIFIGDNGSIEKIEPRPRLESHQLIEEFMVLANVAAAKFITSKGKPCLFRVHDEPAEERAHELSDYLKAQNMPASLPKGSLLKPRSFTQVLQKVKDHPLYAVINQMVLRSQSRAEYAPENIGHFGLNLTHYAHFTSPIRRYADLLVHRALESIIEKKPGLYPYTEDSLGQIGADISECERRSTKAERETIDRYIALHLEDRSGETFQAVVSGMTEFAIFLTLSETKSDGILPLRNLNGDYFTYDSKSQSFYGRRTRRRLNMGDTLEVSLEFANPVTGSVVFSASLEEDRKRAPQKKYNKPKKFPKRRS